MNYLRGLMLTFFLLACTTEEHFDRYRYDTSTGKCRNSVGEEGLNPFDRNYIRSRTDAECVDLSGRELILLHTRLIPGNRLGYDTLDGYNFKGAKMDTAQLFFNHIFAADLRGANLSTLLYGYAIVKGRIDQYTVLPLEGRCQTVGDSLDCIH